jgi:large subunit ribosomal protein L29
MKISDIRKMEKKELEKNLDELRGKFSKMRFDVAGKQIKNHRDIRKTRKDIARVLTLLRQAPAADKSLAGKPGGQAV